MSKLEHLIFSNSVMTVLTSTANYCSNNYLILTQLVHTRNFSENHFVELPNTSGSHYYLLASSSRPQSLSSASKVDRKVSGLLFPSNLVKLDSEGVDLGVCSRSKLLRTICSARRSHASKLSCDPEALTCALIYAYASVKRAIASAASLAI